ncbi:2OG-Fe(II) oxygenase [Nonomuraea polychroma]
MLLYETGQFFVAHQDSEKDDAMVATLVVTLPSAYTGGELVVEHQSQTKKYRGLKTAVSLVAFYADCRHQVLPVKTGNRVTLTYNLLLTGDSQAVAAEHPLVTDLAACLHTHFTTPVVLPYSHRRGDPPARLAYLLDHEYTARGLSWSRLKGSDAARGALLRAAAEQAGCEITLALAEIQETWDAYDPDEDEDAWYGDYEDEDPDDYEDSRSADDKQYVLQDLSRGVAAVAEDGDAPRLTKEVSKRPGVRDVRAKPSSPSLTCPDLLVLPGRRNWAKSSVAYGATDASR